MLTQNNRPKRAVLMSVPHTGTNFTVKLFRDRGFEDLNLQDRPSIRRPSLHHGHIMKPTQIEPALMLAESMPLVVPLRHPYRVEESWRRRGKDIALLVQCLNEMTRRFTHAHFFRVDTQDREAELRALSDYMGVWLRSDWSPQASKHGTHDAPLEELTPSEPIIALTAGQFFSRFYDTQPQVKHDKEEEPIRQSPDRRRDAEGERTRSSRTYPFERGR